MQIVFTARVLTSALHVVVRVGWGGVKFSADVVLPSPPCYYLLLDHNHGVGDKDVYKEWDMYWHVMEDSFARRYHI